VLLTSTAAGSRTACAHAYGVAAQRAAAAAAHALAGTVPDETVAAAATASSALIPPSSATPSRSSAGIEKAASKPEAPWEEKAKRKRFPSAPKQHITPLACVPQAPNDQPPSR